MKSEELKKILTSLKQGGRQNFLKIGSEHAENFVLLLGAYSILVLVVERAPPHPLEIFKVHFYICITNSDESYLSHHCKIVLSPSIQGSSRNLKSSSREEGQDPEIRQAKKRQLLTNVERVRSQ